MNSQIKRDIEQSLGGSRVQELLSHATGVRHPPIMDMFTNPILWNFMEASSRRHDYLLTLSLEDRRGVLKTPNF